MVFGAELQVFSRSLLEELAAGMTTGFSPPTMPDDSLALSAILDDSGLAEDGLMGWLGEPGVKGRTAMSAHRVLLPVEDDIRPRDSVSAAGCCSQSSDDIRLLEGQLALEEARAAALAAQLEAEQKEMAVRLSQTRLSIAEAQSRSAEFARSRWRTHGAAGADG